LALLGAHGQVTARTVAAWRDEQLAAGLSHATVRQRMAAVRAFAAWATRTGRVRIDDTLDLAAVQAPRSSGQHTSVRQCRAAAVDGRRRRQRVA